jgi:signal transduction histidine kinase
MIYVRHSMKRISEDVQTLSKLETNIIVIKPVRVRPTDMVTDTLKIFNSECTKEDIELEFHEDSSLTEQGASWVMLDPFRVVQVTNCSLPVFLHHIDQSKILMNAITNALKSTSGRATRKIGVHLGATPEQPSEELAGLVFDPPDLVTKNLDESRGNNGQVFIWIRITDTGYFFFPSLFLVGMPGGKT